MSALVAERTAEVVGAAEQLLEKRMGAAVRLVDPVELGQSGRTMVLRVRVAENAYSLPRTVIVKQVKQSARDRRDFAGWDDGSSPVDSAFLREAVSYQFATALARDDRPGADLLALDLDARLLIISDLGGGDRLSELLRDGDDAAAHSLMALAQALGRMHAATVGREVDFAALLRRAEVAHHTDGISEQAHAAVDEVPVLLREHLEVDVPGEVLGTVREAAKLFGAGRFRAFSPSDLCPENVLVNEDGIRFLDYEWGGFRDATLDIAYVLGSFPGCLCGHPVDIDRARAMADAWRAEVVGMWPQLADDGVLAARIVEAQLIWTWLSTYWFLPDDHLRLAAVRDHWLAVPRATALTDRWTSLAATARVAGRTDIAGFAEQVVAALRAKWSD